MLSAERLFQLNFNLSTEQESMTDKSLDAYKEIIAFVNPKSGGLKGKAVYEQLKKHLNVENVFDLSQSTPKQGYDYASSIFFICFN